MGREIRMVPPNYIHEEGKTYFDDDFESASSEWKAEFLKWESGENRETSEFWEYYGNPPERENYRPWKDEEATWFQVWETVSEGSPVTPPFATKEELIEYLVSNGDFWDQQRFDRPWSRKDAESFVNGTGWIPSLIIENGNIKKTFDV
jgi:hypothetical protein